MAHIYKGDIYDLPLNAGDYFGLRVTTSTYGDGKEEPIPPVVRVASASIRRPGFFRNGESSMVLELPGGGNCAVKYSHSWQFDYTLEHWVYDEYTLLASYINPHEYNFVVDCGFGIILFDGAAEAKEALEKFMNEKERRQREAAKHAEANKQRAALQAAEQAKAFVMKQAADRAASTQLDELFKSYSK